MDRQENLKPGGSIPVKITGFLTGENQMSAFRMMYRGIEEDIDLSVRSVSIQSRPSR